MSSRRSSVAVLALLALAAGLLGLAPPASARTRPAPAAAPAGAAAAPAAAPAGPYTSAVRADAPSAFWRLSGATGVTDSLGHVGAPQTTGSECSGCGGRTPGAILTENADGHRHFDGTYGYFYDKSATATGTYLQPGTAWTVEGWFRVAAGTTGTGLIYGWGPSVGQSIGITDGKPFGYDHVASGFLGTATATVTSSTAYDDGKWHLLDFVRSGTDLTLYVDTVPVGTSTTGGGGTAYTALFSLDEPAVGEYFSGLGGDNYFGGDVDDVALYPAALVRANLRTHWTASGRALTPSGDPIVPAEVLGGVNPAVRNRCTVCASTPVNPLTGNYTHSFTDVRVAGRGLGLAFTRTYNSQDAAAGRSGPLGPGWTTGYGMRLSAGTDGSATVLQENGAQVRFVAGASSGTYTPAAPRFTATLVKNADGGWTYQRLSGTRFTFDPDGRLVQERDLDGYPVTLGYSGTHLTSITASTDAADATATRSLTLAYDDAVHPDLVTAVTDGVRPPVHYAYDDAGDLVDVTDMTGGHTRFTYAGHLLRTIRQPAYDGSTASPAPVASIEYDTATPPRVARQVDELGAATAYAWAPGLADPYAADLDPATLSGAMTVTDAKGDVTVNDFAAGELVAQVLGYGSAHAATWRYTYDPDTLGMTTVTDPTGATTVRAYDGHGNLLSETVDPAGLNRRTLWTYNALDRVTSVQEPRSVAWESAHPGNAGYVTTYAYYPAGSTSVGGSYPAGYNLKSISTPLWDASDTPVTTRTVTLQRFGDGDANPADVTGYVDGAGNAWTVGHDAYGDVVSVASPSVDDQGGDAASNVTRYCVDAVGRVVETVSPRGSPGFTCPSTVPDDPAPYTTLTSYDPYDRVTSIKDPLYRGATSATAHRSTFTYDASGRLVSRTDGAGNRTDVAYNALNKVTAVTSGAGTEQAATVGFAYDAIGNITAVTDGLDHTTRYAYDDAAHPSSVTAVTDALQRTTSYGYDGAGRVVSRQDPAGTGACPGAGSACVTYTRDASGATTSVAYADDTPGVTLSYDANGDRTAMTDGAGSHAYAYDSLHRLTSATTATGGTTTGLQYAYDLRDRPTCVTYPGSHPVSNGYDAAGRLAWTADWVNGSSSCTASKPAQAITFAYDADSDLTGTTVPSTPSVRDTVTYDATGAPTAVSTAATGAATPLASYVYARNGLGQVTGEATGGSPQTPFTYSPRGQLTGAGAAAFGYDAADHPVALAGRVQQFDAAGQLCWSAPSAAATPPGCDAPPGGATTYTYAPNGTRTGSSGADAVVLGYDLEHRLTSYGAAGATTAYGYDGDGLRTSRTPSSGAASAFTWDVAAPVPVLAQEATGASVTSYLYGPDGSPVEQVQPDGSVLYLHHDQLGSTRTVTDAAGAVVDTFTYDAFGRTTARTGTDAVRPGFAGEYTDPESGLVYLRARHYDPATGQFLTRDPLEAQTGSAYGYAGNDPVNAVDPLGLQELVEYGSLLEGEAGAASAAFAEGSMVIPDTAVAVTEAAAEDATAAAEGAAEAAGSAGDATSARGGVYSLRDEAGNVVRTGRTNDLAAREAAHAKDPTLGDYEFNVEYRTDVYAEQRGLEQVLYDRYPLARAVNGGFNKIRAVSLSNPRFDFYLESAAEYLGRLAGG